MTMHMCHMVDTCLSVVFETRIIVQVEHDLNIVIELATIGG